MALCHEVGGEEPGSGEDAAYDRDERQGFEGGGVFVRGVHGVKLLRDCFGNIELLSLV